MLCNMIGIDTGMWLLIPVYGQDSPQNGYSNSQPLIGMFAITISTGQQVQNVCSSTILPESCGRELVFTPGWNRPELKSQTTILGKHDSQQVQTSGNSIIDRANVVENPKHHREFITTSINYEAQSGRSEDGGVKCVFFSAVCDWCTVIEK